MARRSGQIRTGETTIAREVAGVIAADSPTLTDANIPPVGGLDCTGYDTIMVGVEITAPGTATMTLEALFYDADQLDGARWSRAILGAPPGVTPTALAAEKTTAMENGSHYCELRVFGHRKVFLRVDAVANSGGTTAYKILVRPGKVRGDRPINRAS